MIKESRMGHAEPPATIVGGGLVGPLLALYLARRGIRSDVFEARQDRQGSPGAVGRSINITLTARGFARLAEVGLLDQVLEHGLRLRGRLVHGGDGTDEFQAYGRRGEFLLAISRGTLNRLMLAATARVPLITLRAGQRCADVDADAGTLRFVGDPGAVETVVRSRRIVAADGALSGCRAALLNRRQMSMSQRYCSLWYKELSIPPTTTGDWALDPTVLHVWPRGEHLIVAFPNRDRSFTCTLFLTMERFQALTTPEQLLELLNQGSGDLVDRVPTLVQQFFSRAWSPVLSVRCSRWFVADTVALVGDAARAVVPFLGQGTNASFEDCASIDALLDRHDGDWPSAFRDYERNRKPEAEALDTLSHEHMAELSRDRFSPRQELERRLEQRLREDFPDRFVSLYWMIAFSRLSYTQAVARNERQKQVVDRLADVPQVDGRWPSPDVQCQARELVEALGPFPAGDDQVRPRPLESHP